MIIGVGFLAAAAVAAAAPEPAPIAVPPAAPAVEASAPAEAKPKPKLRTGPNAFFEPTATNSRGSVTIDGRKISYRAVAGTLVVHAKDWEDTDWREFNATAKADDTDEPKPEASMFYAAYFRDGVPSADRPITFAFNGGPGSSSIWLHMGAFGPRRVETVDLGATRAPFTLVNNDKSLLDVTDLVFVDAPGAGFSRVAGKDKDKAFFGVDQDIDAFAQFIDAFLSTYHRWESPKFVMGESYGTMRGAGLAPALQDHGVDLNGLILLSDILNWDLVPDEPRLNPGMDLPYVVALPSYAATAWYHQRIQRPPGPIEPFLADVEAFATGDYLDALMQGNRLSAADRDAMARRLSAYTGLSVSYLLQSNLRIDYGAFQQQLLAGEGKIVGTLDTRYVGPSIEPLDKLAGNDPQSSAISAAYISTYNDYVRTALGYGAGIGFKPGIPVYSSWDYRHKAPGASRSLIALPNVLLDLALAMKRNPSMKVMVNGGYFDISTPYFAGKYELRHLPVGPALDRNIAYHYYESGHMIFVHPPSFAALRTNVRDFILGASAGR